MKPYMQHFTEAKVSRAEQRIQDLTDACVAYSQDLSEEHVAAFHLDIDTAQALGVGIVTQDNVRRGHEAYIGRVCFPYTTRAGVVDARFYCTQQHDCEEQGHERIVALPGSTGHMYNVAALLDPTNIVVIVEDEPSAALLTQLDIPAVAVTGPQAYKPHYARGFTDIQRVLVVGSGTRFGKLFVQKLSQNIPDVTPLLCPDNYNIVSVYARGGEKSIARVLGAHNA